MTDVFLFEAIEKRPDGLQQLTVVRREQRLQSVEPSRRGVGPRVQSRHTVGPLGDASESVQRCVRPVEHHVRTPEVEEPLAWRVRHRG